MKRVIFLTLLALFFSLSPDVSAEEAKGLGVYPPVIKIKSTPPAEISIPIKVRNLGDKPIEADISIRALNIDQNGTPNLTLYKDYTREMTELLEAVRIKEKDQTVSSLLFSPREEKNLELNINLDKNIKAKDYYLSLILLAKSQESSTNSHSLVTLGVSSSILLSLGNNETSYETRLFSSLFTFEDKLKLEGSITNNGKSFVVVKPQIVIENVFGKKIEVIDLGEQILLAGQTKKLYNTQAETVLASENKYLFGPYRVSLWTQEDNRKNISNNNRIIFVFPGWTILMPIIAVFITLLITKRVIAKRRRSR